MTARINRVGPESALLASEVAYVSSLLDQADASGQGTNTRLLFNAAEGYQRTKNLFSVIELDPQQKSQFLEQLTALRARLLRGT